MSETVQGSKPKLITTEAFHKALLAAGVVAEGERIRRIVIDAEVGSGGVRIFVERFGDERLIGAVRLGLNGIEVDA